MFEVYNHRIDWIDSATGHHCFDLFTEETARWEVQNDYMNEIYSVTRIIDKEGNESENLLKIFRNL